MISNRGEDKENLSVRKIRPAAVPIKTIKQKEEVMAGRANKICPECNTMVNSNRQPKCKKCGHLFVMNSKKKNLKRTPAEKSQPSEKTVVNKDKESPTELPRDFISITAADSNILTLLTLRKIDLERDLAAVNTTLETIKTCCIREGQKS